MSDLRPKVLFISHSAQFGGAERCLYYLLKGMHRDKYDLSVLAPPRALVRKKRQQDFGKLVAELDIPVCRTPIRWWVGRWPRYPAFAMGLANRVNKIVDFLQRKEIDLVVSNSCAFAEGALAARRCGIPHVWHVLEMLDQDPVLRPVVPLRQLYRLMNCLSSRIITVSEAVRKGLESHVRSDKLRVVHTGLPEIAPRPMTEPKRTMFDLPPDAPVITFVGLLSERKSVVDLVDGAPEILQRFPRATFILAGPDGGEGQRIAKKIGEYGIGHAFRILGQRHDIPNILAASDMLVLTSVADPLPLAVIEAMRMGVPVVATRSGGCEEMVLHGKTGYLVPSGSPDSLAEAIIALLEKPGDCARMGQNGRQRFEDHFSYRHYIANFEQVLDEVLAIPKRADANGTALTHAIIDRLQSSAISQTRTMAGNRFAFTQYKFYAEAMARCLSLL